jgi:hypothetical protein
MSDDFYIGWEAKAPASHGRATRRVVLAVLILVLLAGLGFAASQRLIGVAFFEWGKVKQFTGLLRADPYPHLVLAAEGTNQVHGAAPLVAPFKFGVRREDIARFDGRRVTLRGTRIHRDGRLMIELVPGSIIRSGDFLAPPVQEAEDAPLLGERSVSLGRQTFFGEIVDSKCWMGVMNPGVLAPHRACAVRCISGGIPPMLLVRRENAPPLNLLLTDALGKPVNDRVLDFVAEPVEIAGEVLRQGELLTLRADPATYRRIGR